MPYTLYIGNKNYSSWSMRPWVVMKHFDIQFEEKLVRFDSFAADSIFKQTIVPLNQYGTVPVLVDNDLIVTDTLAICEYLADKHPDLPLWPTNINQRTQARILVAKMYSGYQHIRHHFPMNIEASFPEIGQIVLRDHPEVKKERQLLDQSLSTALQKSEGDYLFGQFSIADAFYAPMCLRLKNFNIPTSETLERYIHTVCQTKGVQDWISDALLEKDFIPMDEPYRFSR
ncbi:glutathione S-transferase family protein [Neisseria sp. Ec49-e6-T10]|uniref:glutathione S-transferase family protein n=1 Tax=Neisseria sp. Ec49-e6-T10 TaxID=3140744 RepID=UPI003EC0CD4C